MQTSKFEIGDKVLFAGLRGTITEVGVLGSKLTPNRTYVYEMDLENGKHVYGVADWAISKQ